MIDKEKAKLNMKVQWAKFIVVMILYLLFLFWLESWLGLIVIPFIYDVYITKKINWQWWKDLDSFPRMIMSWVDALVFALVAVYFINLFFFQNYVIPSSSLEKSLLTGDYLFVSKASYGPRIPQTPLTVPLTQHTMPIIGTKSYIEWPQWDYRRAAGLGKVELNDIVVFNYPAGDSICTEEQYQTNYYELCYGKGNAVMHETGRMPVLDSLSDLQLREYYNVAYQEGRRQILADPNTYGGIDSRPVDRRENYVKRCVGVPGQTLQIKNHIVYLDGKANKEPENVQYNYFVKLNGINLPQFLGAEYDDLRKELLISGEDIVTMGRLHGYDLNSGLVINPAVLQEFDGYMPLTKRAAKVLKDKHIITKYRLVTDKDLYTGDVYPLNGNYHWTRDNYGPVTIPAKGQTLKLDLHNLPIYERCIRVYEGNDLEVKDGKIYINGKLSSMYTFKMDYYWMMGDNRHNSADSRYWGFVPEDHIVGKPIFIWWSSDPDRKGFSGIRWERLFRFVDSFK